MINEESKIFLHSKVWFSFGWQIVSPRNLFLLVYLCFISGGRLEVVVLSGCVNKHVGLVVCTLHIAFGVFSAPHGVFSSRS